MEPQAGGTGHVPAFNAPMSVVISLAVLILVHVGRNLLSADDNLSLMLTLAFIPARYVVGMPALPGGDIAAVTSFLTYMLVHGDVMHLAVNGIWMLAFGSAVARRLGDARFLLFSLLAGVAGVLLHLALHFGELVPVVGASAAISGQMAGALRFLFSAGPDPFAAMRGDPRGFRLQTVPETLRNPRILAFVGVWMVINLIFGLGYVQLDGQGSSIAWEAHVGGFVCGLLTFGLFDPPSRRWQDNYSVH